MRVLNQRDVLRLLPVERCIDVMAEAMTASARGEMVQPLRTVIAGGAGLFGVMPGALKGGIFGAKLVSVFERQAASELQSHQGLMILFDPDSGLPSALVEAGALTAIRTAAATALATRILAREDAQTLCVIGAGAQAALHIRALCAVRNFAEIRIWSRSSDKTSAVAARAQVPGMVVKACNSLRTALAGADVICTLTASKIPLFNASAIGPGVHINLVGSSTPDAQEVESDVVAAGLLFVDSRKGVTEQGGEFRAAMAAGLVDEAHIVGEIGEVICGRVPGRTSSSDITLYKSLGLVAQDLFAAKFIVEAAEKAGRGVLVDISGHAR